MRSGEKKQNAFLQSLSLWLQFPKWFRSPLAVYIYIVPTKDVREDANSVSGKPHGSGSNATNKSCETLRATLRGETGALVFMCQNRHISDALLNIKSGRGCMPYLRFAAAAPRIKHTNARSTLSPPARVLYTPTRRELTEGARPPGRSSSSFITSGNNLESNSASSAHIAGSLRKCLYNSQLDKLTGKLAMTHSLRGKESKFCSIKNEIVFIDLYQLERNEQVTRVISISSSLRQIPLS